MGDGPCRETKAHDGLNLAACDLARSTRRSYVTACYNGESVLGAAKMRNLISHSVAPSGSAACIGEAFLDPGQTDLGLGAVCMDGEGRPVFSLRLGGVTHRFVPEAHGTVGGGVTRRKLLGLTER